MARYSKLLNPTEGKATISTPTIWVIFAGCLLLIALIVLRPWSQAPFITPAGTNAITPVRAQTRITASRTFLPRREDSSTVSEPAKTPEQIVAAKVQLFGRKRRELARQTAKRLNKEVSPEVEKFFDAIESGDWDEIHARWKVLADGSGQYGGSDKNAERDPCWAEVLDAYGVAEQAHLWPAQKLLDYGEAVLGSLRPGMVYVGGTDNGRWIPELLNETGQGEPHIIVTQNALADGTYLEFVNRLYADQMSTLSSEDSQRAFQDYLNDAQRRLKHDQEFPDEPKQVNPGENVAVVDGRVQVSGAVAVMAINEKLLQMLMQKNPGLSFAMEESFPMKGLYADAAPLGPLTELQASTSGQEPFTAERAAQSLEFWRTQTQTVLADSEAAASETTLRAWSHQVNAAANLLAAHDYSSEAEQAYRLSSQLCPYSPEAANGLARLLISTGRADEARQLLDNFARSYPDQRQAIEEMSGTFRVSTDLHKSKP